MKSDGHIPSTARVRVPPSTNLKVMDGEGIVTSSSSNSFYSLDRLGLRMWQVVTKAGSFHKAYQQLLAERTANPDELHRKLTAMVQECVGEGLLQFEE
jgi:hypothetical protein